MMTRSVIKKRLFRRRRHYHLEFSQCTALTVIIDLQSPVIDIVNVKVSLLMQFGMHGSP